MTSVYRITCLDFVDKNIIEVCMLPKNKSQRKKVHYLFSRLAKSSFSMKLQIPSSLASAQYYLEVKGKVGKEVLFENSTRLTYLNKGMSVFVQTDKAIYKPGQLGRWG